MRHSYEVGKSTRLQRLNRPLKGPRLVDIVMGLITANGLTGADLTKRYGINPAWLTQQRKNPGSSPACDVMQVIYEDLTGRPLLSNR